MSYARKAKPPRTLTEAECKRVLRLSGRRAEHFDDHMLIALALGTGLRVSELSALDCGDVYTDTGSARARVTLRVFKGQAAGERVPQEVMISDGLRAKLDRFRRWKQTRHQSVLHDSPLFTCVVGRPRKHGRPLPSDYIVPTVGTLRRLSRRRILERWHRWRDAAGLSPALTAHALRHTFCQRLYDQTRDLLLVKRAARHVYVTTTNRYAAASTEDVLRAVQACEL